MDFVLPQQNITYTPCGRNHTHHAEDWPLTGTISISKCERQCRFRACKAWSQSAAALRKHVNAHIANNKLDLTVLPASNGREPLKISVSDDHMVSQDAFHQPSSIKPMPYSSFDSPLPSGVESDSGYGSTPSSVQQMANENERFAWSSPGKRPSPFPAAPRNATKRIRPATDHLDFSLLGNPKQVHEDSGSEILLSAEVSGGVLSPQRLDAIMAKAQTLRDAGAQASSTRDRSPFRQGSPLAPSGSTHRNVPRTRQQWPAGSQAHSLLQHPNQDQRPKTISPKMMGLSFHEIDEPSSHFPPQPSDRASYPFSGQETMDLSGPFESHQQREVKTSSTPQSPTDFIKPWPQQVEGGKRSRASLSLQPPNFQMQFGGAVDTAASSSQKRRISSLIGDFDDGYSPAQDHVPAPTPLVADERSQRRSDSHLNSNRDFELLWSGAHSRSIMSQQQVSNDSLRHHAAQFSSNPSIHVQRVAAIIQSIGRPTSRTTSTSKTLFSPPTEDEERLVCPTCGRSVRNRSELKKHELRHRKPFLCDVPGCIRVEGFSTANDLERHTKSKHPSSTSGAKIQQYKCRVPGCKSVAKSWPRQDNFRSHLRRVHGLSWDGEMDSLVRIGQYGTTTSDNADANAPKPKTLGTPGGKAEGHLDDLQSLHVLADSAVLGEQFNQWPPNKEQKV